MDGFVEGLELLINADAGRLIVVAVILTVFGMGYLSWQLIRLFRLQIEARKEADSREESRLEVQATTQAQMNASVLNFVTSVDHSTQQIAAAVSALQQVIPAVQNLASNMDRHFTERKAEHKEQNETTAHLLQLVEHLTTEVKNLPQMVADLLDQNGGQQIILDRLAAVERNLTTSLTSVMEELRHAKGELQQ
jgi:hypothetical protein